MAKKFRIIRRKESLEITDQSGRGFGYTYFEDQNKTRRETMNRLTSQEAVKAAKIMARALEDGWE